MNAGALQGIRVIDWTIMHQGPAGGMFLAELGADVIHVEQKGVGDVMRGLHSVFGVSMDLPGDRHVLFEDLNKNKRGIAIDLTKPQGKEIMYGLVRNSDVFLTNYRPKAAEKLGLDYETLRELNPRLIYGLATSYGDRGPEGNSPGVEVVPYARSGAMAINGLKGDPPSYPPSATGDRIGGIFLALGAITALLVRERTGKGQRYSTSQLGGMTSLISCPLTTVLLTGRAYQPDRHAEADPLYNYYQCRDGRYLALALNLNPDPIWPQFCRAVDLPDLAEDSRFKEMAARSQNRAELVAILDRHFASRDCGEWEKKLRDGGDFIFTRINTPEEAVNDPQILANEYVVDFDHPVLGKVKQVALPIHFSETPARIHSPAPDYGQHTVEVLQEILGYSMENIVSLMEQDII